jgi:hypothetical protein
MGLLSNWRQRRAAKAYAERLGPWLARSFGASGAYTAAQIRRGIEVLHLDANYVAFGYAAFLSAAEYEQHTARLPVRLSYGQARALLLRHGPSAPLRPLADDSGRADDLAHLYRRVEGHAYEGDT